MTGLKRWVDSQPAAGSSEAEAARWVKGVGPAATLSPQALARVRARLSAPPLRAGWLKPAWAALGVVTASAAAVALARALFTAPLEAPPAATLPVAVVEVRPPRPVSVPLAEPSAPAPVAPGRPRRSAPAPAAAAPVLPAPNPLLEESRLLGEAVQQLRLEGRPEAALEVLGRYQLRFPDGALKGEADAVRLEALLKQGQSAPALELLARLAERDFAQVPRADELRVVHGELLARAGRHREAVAAFTRALEHLGANERSLFGRAASRLELNEREAARNDLAECVRLFPNGRFATDARNQLAAP